MSLRTLWRGLMLAALAVAITGPITAVASADASSPAAVTCRLGADVILVSTDTRVHGVGTVRCTDRVFQIDVAVTLSQDNVIVARDQNSCRGVANCRADAAAPNRPGIQVWCAQSSGHYALSPTGPVIDLGSTRVCERG